MKLYYKVKYGYKNADNIIIENKADLEKAVYALYSKSPVHLAGAYINGSNIISIAPHWNKYTGWHDNYDPQSGEDMAQINRDAPKKELEAALTAVKTEVQNLMQSGKTALIGQDRKQLTSGV